MSLSSFLQKIHTSERVSFQDTLVVIAENYHYQPVEFHNGLGQDQLINTAGQNEGSCRLFAFAQLNGLDPSQTLSLFGDYYWLDVLNHPDGTDHQNIRNFMKYGWEGIVFKGVALSPK